MYRGLCQRRVDWKCRVNGVALIPTVVSMLAARGRAGPADGADHLFLLPGRVLGMDDLQLRQDLAGLDFSVQLLHTGPRGHVWLCESLHVSKTDVVIKF